MKLILEHFTEYKIVWVTLHFIKHELVNGMMYIALRNEKHKKKVFDKICYRINKIPSNFLAILVVFGLGWKIL
jgi:hypothetical protein